MIQVSRQYKEAVYAPTRRTKAKVGFEILDNEAYNDNTSIVTGEAPISRKGQLTNKKRNMDHKYATFEKDYFKLDGSFCIPPTPDEGNSELGWWSDDISDENGVFTSYQILEFNFTEEHNSMGLTITFDTMANEYASDFDIEIYRLDGTLIHKEEVTGNDNPLYVLIKGLDNYGRIVITIKKWAKPYRRARITEVDFGVIQEYQDDKIIKLNMIEEMNIISDKIPSNEIKFTIDNKSKEFNILNPEGFYRFLKERQEVQASIGVEVRENEFEYIPMGKFYLTDWQSDEGALTASFTARDVFELLESIDYKESLTNTNLYDLVEDVLTKANVKDYFIDEGLKNIPTNGFTKSLNSRKALQYIGIAGKAAVYQCRQGILQIKQFKVLDKQDTQYVYFAGPDMFCGMIYPMADEGYDMKNITFDNIYNEPQIKLDKLLYSLVMVVNNGEEKQEVTFYNEGIKEGSSFKVDNPLINSIEHAEDVAKWIIEEYNLRAVYSINWRQNPCLECGDIVLVEDSYDAKKLSRITKQEFEYAGYLGGKTETKGGV